MSFVSNKYPATIQSSKSPKRVLGLDLLRIIAMLFIVANHWLGHGLSMTGFDPSMPHSYFLWFIRGLSYTGTNLFILISSYFLCKSTIQVKHLLSLVCQVLFYSVTLYWITYALGLHKATFRGVVESFFPVTLSRYWFITCYIGLYLLSPFLNKLFAALTSHGHKCLLIVLLLFFSIIPNLVFFSPWLNWGGSCGIVWFVVLYFIGAYIRYYADIEQLKENKSRLLMWGAIICFLPLLSKVIIAKLTLALLGHVEGSSVFFSNNSILIVPMSIFFFLLFLTIDIKNKWIISCVEFLAGGVFSVYLITEDAFIRSILWDGIALDINPQNVLFPVFFIVGVIIIFLSCIFLDLIRRGVFQICSKTKIPSTIMNLIAPFFNRFYSGISVE